MSFIFLFVFFFFFVKRIKFENYRTDKHLTGFFAYPSSSYLFFPLLSKFISRWFTLIRTYVYSRKIDWPIFWKGFISKVDVGASYKRNDISELIRLLILTKSYQYNNMTYVCRYGTPMLKLGYELRRERWEGSIRFFAITLFMILGVRARMCFLFPLYYKFFKLIEQRSM